jgi:two-component system chemotaxis response regulator CheB
MVMQKKPDLITMDINLPKMNGFQATREIMETSPTPIIMVTSSWDPKENEITFKALEAGALTVIAKPVGMKDLGFEQSARELIQMVKLMSEVKVVRRKPEFRRKEVSPAVPLQVEPRLKPAEVKLVAIGASTGGPVVLQNILSLLPKDFSVPILIVQHIQSGFLQGLVEWLNKTTGYSVHVAAHGEYLLPGNAYFAPPDIHTGVSSGGMIMFSKSDKENGSRPSVSFLFRSVANAFGPNAVGVLLTGMGKDGAEELKVMKEKGAVTIAQDKESSLIFGMPGQAVEIGAAQYILPPDKIVQALLNIVNRKTS